jgi:hypothetical protein
MSIALVVFILTVSVPPPLSGPSIRFFHLRSFANLFVPRFFHNIVLSKHFVFRHGQLRFYNLC